MPLWIRHRVNSIEQLKTIPLECGAEIDLRSDVSVPGSIHLSHDPWVKGELLENWLRVFAERRIQGPIIFNTKEDALESRTFELCEKFGIRNFFFLDTTVPTLVRWLREGKGECFAVRVSQYEPSSSIQLLGSKIKWVWVDCFGGNPMPATEVEKAKALGCKVCLVSPELQGRPLEEIRNFKDLWSLADAVCTKGVESWNAHVGLN